MTKTGRGGIYRGLEKIREEIESHEFDFDSHHLKVTISVGLVTFDEVRDLKSNEILKIVDDRLYRAKARGRNVVVDSQHP